MYLTKLTRDIHQQLPNVAKSNISQSAYYICKNSKGVMKVVQRTFWHCINILVNEDDKIRELFESWIEDFYNNYKTKDVSDDRMTADCLNYLTMTFDKKDMITRTEVIFSK